MVPVSRYTMLMQDKIFLQGLEVRCIIGTLPHERRKKQPVVIDLEFPAPVKKAARRDNLKDALNYHAVAKCATEFISKSRFFLIETLAEKLAAFLLKEFPIDSLTLKIMKPKAIRNAKYAGVLIKRKKRA